MELANSSKQELAIRSKKAICEVLKQFPNRVIVSADFRNVITTVKEIEAVTHPLQVYNALRDYIFSKGLQDKDDPFKVNCKNDQLGAILGMDEFTIADVAKILLKFVFPANSGVCSSHNDVCKRKGEEIIAEVKKFKNVGDDIHISPSSVNDPSGSAGNTGSGETSVSKNFADYFSCTDERYINIVKELATSSKQELALRSKKAICEVLRQFPNRVIVSTDFRNVITTVKEIEAVTDPLQVYNAFRDYIFSKRLLDKDDPFKVNCKDDQLGAILGMNEFTLVDVAKILLKFVFPANSGVCSSHNDDCKRKGEEIIAEVKNFKDVADDIHISLSSSVNDSSGSAENADIHISLSSCVNDPSESAGNSGSDEASEGISNSSEERYSIVAVKETFDIEYEVESDSSLSVGSASSFSDSDSEILDTLNAAIIEVICKEDSDVEFWADNSSDDEYSSLESVKTGCSSCGELNILSNNLCSECFHKRMELLALEKTRPKRKFRSKRKRTRASAKINQEDTSQKDVALECVPSTSSQESVPSESTDSQPLSDLSQVQKLCLLCCDRPANGTIVHAHSKYAHTISCYPCAKRLQREKKKCPICRRRIDRVVCSV